MKTHDLPLHDETADALSPWGDRDDWRDPPTVRDLLALLLRTASRALDRLALSLARPAVAAPATPMLEFHAEAGAPEGALYVDGRLVGRLEGVTRL